MTQITKEAIEAAKSAYWTEVHHGGGYSDKCYEAALTAALPFLPIAVEGKVKALEWEQNDAGSWYAASVLGTYLVNQGRWWRKERTPIIDVGDDDAAKTAAQTDYETRILSALISSPGNDGGQEEADELREKLSEAEAIIEERDDRMALVDRIADLIGLPQDQELDQVAFELWFSKTVAKDGGQEVEAVCCGKPVHVGSPEAYTLECCEKFVRPHPARRIADAIEACDWSGCPIGNKEILKAAVKALRNETEARDAD